MLTSLTIRSTFAHQQSAWRNTARFLPATIYVQAIQNLSLFTTVSLGAWPILTLLSGAGDLDCLEAVKGVGDTEEGQRVLKFCKFASAKLMVPSRLVASYIKELVCN
jgi:hypothetical protein